jgi:hypothetical protein
MAMIMLTIALLPYSDIGFLGRQSLGLTPQGET